MYESSRFTAHGVRHHEMYFPDGTCPSEHILLRFLEVAEREPGALAVSGGRDCVEDLPAPV
jgi:cell division cycle 14